MNFDIVIGLEIHCQLNTQSKIFASDSNHFGTEANTNISVLTLAHPGVLPMLNKAVVASAIKLGLALDCTINQFNFFDRKNYFYPDLPKGYQTTQDKEPICKGGHVKIKLKAGKTYTEPTVQIHHIHLEEDAGKSIHDLDPTYTFLDYNRAGTPLLEIVSEPCMNSPQIAAAYLNEVRKIVRFLGISDGNMEEGSLRADLNVSLKPKGSSTLGTKVEIKNMNSIKFLQKAAEYEVERQSAMLLKGEKILQETRSFDPVTGITTGMRVKETMNDYRYFPEPDLAPIVITEEEIETHKNSMPKLPHALFNEYVLHYGLSEEQAYQISDESSVSSFFEQTCKQQANYKSVANWIIGPLKNSLEIISPVQLAELIKMIDEGMLSNSAAQTLIGKIDQTKEQSIASLANESGLTQNSDNASLELLIDDVLSQQAAKVEEFKKGKKGLMGMFVGEVMKLSKGSADPKIVNEILAKKLK